MLEKNYRHESTKDSAVGDELKLIAAFEMKKLVILPVMIMILFLGSCGLVALVGTPTRHERKIPAEYPLTEHRQQKILVLVSQPGWLGAQANLRYYLTDAMNKELSKKIKVLPENLIAYGELSEFRSNRPDFSLLSAAEVGAALDAGMVLLVMVENYQLSEIAETGYYKGFLDAQVVLRDTASRGKLWPESATGKNVRVGFEVEQRGQEAAVKRLAAACAYCTVRYFYACPSDKFKIAEDNSGVSWENWQ